jgi:hypothetical protein
MRRPVLGEALLPSQFTVDSEQRLRRASKIIDAFGAYRQPSADCRGVGGQRKCRRALSRLVGEELLDGQRAGVRIGTGAD